MSKYNLKYINLLIFVLKKGIEIFFIVLRYEFLCIKMLLCWNKHLFDVKAFIQRNNSLYSQYLILLNKFIVVALIVLFKL